MGTRKRSTSRRQRGGFYPSVMAGVSTNGPYFITAAIAQGFRLIRNNKSRMAARRRGLTRRSKRTRSSKKYATHRQKYAL